MQTRRFPGWYCDATLQGNYAQTRVGAGVRLDEQPIIFPHPHLDCLRMGAGRRIGGTANIGGKDHALRWDGQWKDLGLAHGRDAVAFGADGSIYIARDGNTVEQLKLAGSKVLHAIPVGALGIRQITASGKIITSASTYTNPTLGLNEYTDFGDVAIGHGDDNVGCLIRFADDKVVRLLERGEAKFVNVHRSGNAFTISFHREDTKESVWYWMTLDELRTRPPLVTPIPIPPVSLQPLGRPIQVGYFFRDSQQYGDNESAPGTHSIIVDEPRSLPAEDSPAGPVRMVVGLPCLLHEHLSLMWDKVDVVYVAAEGDKAKLEKDTELARYIMQWRGLSQKPIVSYTGNEIFPDALNSGDIIGVQCYGNDGENAIPLGNRLRPILQSVKDRRVALICQAYDRNSAYWTEARLVALQPLWWQLAKEFPNIVAIYLFSDGRKGGVRDYPGMRPIHAEMARLARAGGAVPLPTPPVPTPIPTPTPIPPGPKGNLEASFYTSIADPRVDPPEFAHRLRDGGCVGTRAWLISAWAVAANGPGQVDGFMPWLRDGDGKFDLEAINPQYLDRLRTWVEAMNTSGITPTLTGWELYTWSKRKEGMLWVPDMNLGPFRNNRQGLVYGDDSAFEVIGTGGVHNFLGIFYAHVAKTLEGLRWRVEIGNEMPEKPLHYRLRDLWRKVGFTGSIQVNRQEDTPGQFANMKIGQADGFDRIAYHGKRDIGYLREEFPDEAPAGRPTTFQGFYNQNPDPSRITLSSDGCRKTTNVEDAYDYGKLAEVAKDALRRGYTYEHQLALKLRTFTHNTLDLNDFRFDSPFLQSLR